MQRSRSFILVLSMLAGYFFSGFFSSLAPLTPTLIFVMLLVTFCRITPSQMRFSRLHCRLLLFQFGVAAAVYAVASTVDHTSAQGLMMCVYAPTAVSVVVIAAMLGADIATMATFTLLSNTAVALSAPVVFSFIGPHSQLPFWESFMLVFSRVIPILVLPFALAFLLKRTMPRVHAAIARYQIVSFYLWTFTLMIVTGQTVNILRAVDGADLRREAVTVAVAFVICIIQFRVGRILGGRFGDKAAGGQSLGQKNTVLAIWMTQSYLDPIASVAPASYVLWQNIVNSWQLWRTRRSGKP